MREIVMTALQAGMRLDHFLERSLREAHAGFIYKMLRKKNITLNGHKAHGNEKLEAGDVVRLYFAGETLEKLCGGAVPGVEAVPGRNRALSAEKPHASGNGAPGRDAPGRDAPGRDAPGGEKPGRDVSGMGGREQREKALPYPTFPSSVRILYEDEHVLLVSKPAGMLTQKAKPGDLSLNEYAIGYLLREGAITRRELQTVRPSVCNRLDRNTSGIVAIGKTVRGLQALSAPLSGPNGQQALSGAGLRGSEERPEN
jgi:23S rRNA pseudouridine955/2504/2580 synthase